ncbi:MAG TPA: glycosyltransferase family A protein [Chroococcidiopsis sp.]
MSHSIANPASPSAAVSVIIPVYNREAYVGDAIRSVLGQTVPPAEVIVVDDGSSDRSAEIIQSFGPPVRYVAQANSGAAVARNRGVDLATGELLAFLDSDDRWQPDKLERQLAALQAQPELAMVFGHVRQFISPDLDADAQAKVRIPAEVMAGYHVGTLLIRRDAFFRVGYFETQWQVGEFVSWQMKATELGLPMQMLAEVVMERRLHATNMGRSQPSSGTDYLRIVRAALDRRRAQGAPSTAVNDGQV